MPPKKSETSHNSISQEEASKFHFVVSTNPSEARSKANKKRVRSVAALKSWPERRKKAFEEQNASSQRGGFVLDRTIAAPIPATPIKPTTTLKRKHRSNIEDGLAKGTAVAAPVKPPSWPPADEELFEKCTRSENGECNCIHCRIERRHYWTSDNGICESAGHDVWCICPECELVYDYPR